MDENKLLFGIDGLPNTLSHHGVLGQKWGVRRYQNPDGTLTPAGKKRYFKKDGSLTRKGRKWDEENKRRQAEKERTERIEREERDRRQKKLEIKQAMSDLVQKYPGSKMDERYDMVTLPEVNVKELGNKKLNISLFFNEEDPTDVSKVAKYADEIASNPNKYAVNGYKELYKAIEKDMAENPSYYEYEEGGLPTAEEVLNNRHNDMGLCNNGNWGYEVSVFSDVTDHHHSVDIDKETMKALRNSLSTNG